MPKLPALHDLFQSNAVSLKALLEAREPFIEGVDSFCFERKHVFYMEAVYNKESKTSQITQKDGFFNVLKGYKISSMLSEILPFQIGDCFQSEDFGGATGFMLKAQSRNLQPLSSCSEVPKKRKDKKTPKEVRGDEGISKKATKDFDKKKKRIMFLQSKIEGLKKKISGCKYQSHKILYEKSLAK